MIFFGKLVFLAISDDSLYQGLPCPPKYNPADFYIHNLAITPGEEEDSRRRITELCDAYEKSEFGKTMAQEAKSNQSVVPSANGGDSTRSQPAFKLKKSPYKADWSTQFRTVLWRSWVSVIREPRVLRMKAVQTIVS